MRTRSSRGSAASGLAAFGVAVGAPSVFSAPPPSMKRARRPWSGGHSCPSPERCWDRDVFHDELANSRSHGHVGAGDANRRRDEGVDVQATRRPSASRSRQARRRRHHSRDNGANGNFRPRLRFQSTCRRPGVDLHGYLVGFQFAQGFIGNHVAHFFIQPEMEPSATLSPNCAQPRRSPDRRGSNR